MAITKLMHMKESPGWPHTHLKNSIDYILDVKHGGKKTQHGVLVGGNCGLNNEEILNNFLETKREYGKLDKRQGYHFVLSFPKGEPDTETAYKVAEEFCQQFLGDSYDYVFAVHTDKEHLHAHVIFNSVSRETGLKYHYKKHDWEKIIQPITDRICREYGLGALAFEEKRVGKSYAEWAAKREGKCNWTNIIRADVDYAIQQADSFTEFFGIMKEMGYELRTGRSWKDNTDVMYYTFRDADGKKHSRRSNYKYMPKGYSPGEVMARIKTKSGAKSYEEVMERLSSQAAEFLKPGAENAVLKSTRTYGRMYQAVSYYKLPNPFAVPSYRVRRDMVRLDLLLEECRYLKEHKITESAQLKARLQSLASRQKELEEQRRLLYGLKKEMSPEQLERMEEYYQLSEQLYEMEEAEQEWEDMEDRMEELEEKFPHEMLEVKARIADCNRDIRKIRKELKVVQRILDTEDVKVQPMIKQNIKM